MASWLHGLTRSHVQTYLVDDGQLSETGFLQIQTKLLKQVIS